MQTLWIQMKLTSNIVTSEFTMDAGLLNRGSAKKTVQVIARRHQVKLAIIEDKGLINSIYYIDVTGIVGNVAAFFREVEGYGKAFNSR